MAKKKFGPVGWILGGCAAFVLVGALVLVGVFIWGAGKVKEFAENPLAAAETLVRMNPDLEVVEKDETQKTLTIRNRRGGEEFTVDAAAILEGRFEVSGSEGQRITFGPEGLVIEDGDKNLSMQSDGAGGMQILGDGREINVSAKEGAVTVQNEEGSVTYGRTDGAASWLPDPGGERMDGGMAQVSAKGVAGVSSYRLTESPAEFVERYSLLLEQQGFTVEGKQSLPGVENLIAEKPDHRITVLVREAQDHTMLTITYEGPE